VRANPAMRRRRDNETGMDKPQTRNSEPLRRERVLAMLRPIVKWEG
jgi:hypothetical protein